MKIEDVREIRRNTRRQVSEAAAFAALTQSSNRY
jgi:hypothetical protein